MGFYPVFLNLKGKRCVVVGGGRVALRKIRGLLKAQAKVCVISPDILDDIKRLHEQNKIELRMRRFRMSDLKGAFLVIAATSNRTLNKMIYNNFSGPINVVDNPELCNFIVPSHIKRKDLMIAISTGGVSPALARSIRKELSKLYPSQFAKYMVFLKRIRGEIIKKIPPERRRKLLTALGSEKIINLLRSKGLRDIKKSAIVRKVSLELNISQIQR